jgi:anthranilate phosphoribosyltransferase
MKTLISKLVAGEDLDEVEAGELLAALTATDLDSAQAAGALIALRTKGEAPAEIRGFAMGLRERAIRPDLPARPMAVDVVGTGGDGSGSLNLSTGAALLAAASGIPVVKHGNRAVSSTSGSADVLAALGVDLPLAPERAAEVFARTGFTFLFAPAYHPAMKSVASVRNALGVRTIFNIAGPLANPAEPLFAVIGAFSPEMAATMAETLSGMPIERAFVVHGDPGWDEVTPVGPYQLWEVTPGSVVATVEDPADFGFDRCHPEALLGGDALHNASGIRDVFAGQEGPHRDALLLGSGLAHRVMGSSMEEGLASAAAALDDGRALRLLNALDERVNV